MVLHRRLFDSSVLVASLFWMGCDSGSSVGSTDGTSQEVPPTSGAVDTATDGVDSTSAANSNQSTSSQAEGDATDKSGESGEMTGTKDPTTSTGAETDSGAPSGTTSTTGEKGDSTTDDTTSTEDVELKPGPDDEFAAAACTVMDGTLESKKAAVSKAEGAQLLLEPSQDTAYLIELPAGGEGWLQVSLPDWNTHQAFFVDGDVQLEVVTGQGSESAKTLNGACVDANIAEQRIKFPHWKPVDVRLRSTSEGKNTVRFMVIQTGKD